MSKESNLHREPRSVRVTKEGTSLGPEYTLQLARETLAYLSEEEAGMLLHQLLLLLPEVPRDAARKWREPKCQVVRYYHAVDGAVRIQKDQLEMTQGGSRKILRRAAVGTDYIYPRIDDQVSKTYAENEAVTQQAVIYCRAKGITMHQLIKELREEREGKS